MFTRKKLHGYEGQDARGDTGCWACSKNPTSIVGHICAVDGCDKKATNVLGYYWNPSHGLGGRKMTYLCAHHGVGLARLIYDGEQLAFLPDLDEAARDKEVAAAREP